MDCSRTALKPRSTSHTRAALPHPSHSGRSDLISSHRIDVLPYGTLHCNHVGDNNRVIIRVSKVTLGRDMYCMYVNVTLNYCPSNYTIIRGRQSASPIHPYLEYSTPSSMPNASTINHRVIHFSRQHYYDQETQEEHPWPRK